MVATMIGDCEVPPPPATEGKRAEQVNVRLSAEERLILEASACRKGFAGLADCIRATAMGADSENCAPNLSLAE